MDGLMTYDGVIKPAIAPIQTNTCLEFTNTFLNDYGRKRNIAMILDGVKLAEQRTLRCRLDIQTEFVLDPRIDLRAFGASVEITIASQGA